MVHRHGGLAVEQLGRARKQQLEVIVDLRHRAHGGARVAHRVGLVDGNRGRHAFDLVYSRLVHAIEELARVCREGLDIAALAFGVERIEHQTGLAGAAGPGDHGQLTGADIDVQIAKIVLASTTDTDQALRHVLRSFLWRPNILGSQDMGLWNTCALLLFSAVIQT